jgi:hypothetical protein
VILAQDDRARLRQQLEAVQEGAAVGPVAVELARATAAPNAATAHLASSRAMVLTLLASVSAGTSPAPAKCASPPARKPVRPPGRVTDRQERGVDVEATVCLDEGMLELLACTKGIKDHESIVAVKARAVHTQAALLLLGANPASPAMRKALGEKGQKTRSIDIPPRGDPADVSLVFKNHEGKMVERPLTDFIARPDREPPEQPPANEGAELLRTFPYAGLLIHGEGLGPCQYLAEVSGNAISIARFGDRLLCLPGLHSHANRALMWQVDATHLLDVGTPVVLRLRPKLRPAGKGRMDTDPIDLHQPAFVMKIKNIEEGSPAAVTDKREPNDNGRSKKQGATQ